MSEPTGVSFQHQVDLLYQCQLKWNLIYQVKQYPYIFTSRDDRPLHNYTDPPEDFSVEMTNKQFLLYLNAHGVPYDVCKKLKGKVYPVCVYSSCLYTILIYYSPEFMLFIGSKVSAKEFNLSSYDSWSLDLKLTSREKKALESLLGIRTIRLQCFCIAENFSREKTFTIFALRELPAKVFSKKFWACHTHLHDWFWFPQSFLHEIFTSYRSLVFSLKRFLLYGNT